MPEVTRRRLLSSAAAGAGGVLASSLLPPALARAAAAGPSAGSLSDIKHVVILMQENRSFDHYFGTLAGVRGFGDPNALIQLSDQASRSSTSRTRIPEHPDGYLLPWHLDTKTTSSQAIPSTSHAWAVQHQALNITVGDGRQPTTAERQLAAGPPDRRRRGPRPVHDELLRAPGHPVPLRAGRELHDLRRLPLLAARADLAQPDVPDDRHDRPERHRRRPDHHQRRPEPAPGAVQLDDLPRAARRRPGSAGGSTRRRTTTAPTRWSASSTSRTRRRARALYERGADDLPARTGSSGTRATAACRPSPGSSRPRAERAPGLPAGDRRRLPGVEARGGRGQPGPVGEDACSSSTTTRTTACSTTSLPPLPPAGTPDEFVQVGARRSPIGGGVRVPCVHHLAVDGRRLRRDRELRPHLGAPVPRAAHRRRRSRTSPSGGARRSAT